MALADIVNFIAIDERIATSGQPSEEQLREIRAEGFEAIVNLGLLDQDYSLVDEAGSVRALGLSYTHIPVIFTDPTPEDFERFRAALRELSGRKVFVLTPPPRAVPPAVWPLTLLIGRPGLRLMSMRLAHQDCVLDDDISRFDFRVCQGWLAGSYWSPGISLREVEVGFRHSTLVVGAYSSAGQVGCLRLASDRTRFAYLMDVFVDPSCRGRGLGRGMVRFAMEHPELALVYQWLLGTHDAHGVYAELGFVPLPNPERFMGRRLKRDWLPELSAEKPAAQGG